MKVYALTGGMASGKSTVAKMFGQFGVPTIDADRVAHQIYAQNTPLYRELMQRYGSDILDADKNIDRKKLGRIVFEKQEERKWLESKTHPTTRQLISKKIAELEQQNPPFILVEAALHVETDYHQEFDGLIVVHVDTATQIQRICDRDGITPDIAKERLKHQMPVDEKKAHGDWVVENSGSLDEIETQVAALYKHLR